MKLSHNKSLTFVEMLVCISIIGYLVYAAVGADIFSRRQMVCAERRAKLQNEVSYALEHMSKNISRAIGDKEQPAVRLVSASRIEVWIDDNYDGKRDVNDKQIAYEFDPSEKVIKYSPDIATISLDDLPLLRRKQINSCEFSYSASDNFVTVTVQACWDATVAEPCGTTNNPSLTMTNRIRMPGVSLN